jgi:hypothetical protein
MEAPHKLKLGIGVVFPGLISRPVFFLGGSMFSHKLSFAAMAVCLAVPLLAGPTLTTIQDVVYRADGTPYSGLVIIKWTPFEAGDTSKIATQSLTVNISGGNLVVQLVPTTNAVPAGYYSVTFASSGNDQFTESWAVPPSTKPLRVRDVLMSQSAQSSALVTGQSPIPETNVIGLTADLEARPVEGPAYAAGRVAYINSVGALDAVSGSVSDCVHVDGSSGPCGTGGSGGPTFSDGEAPAGVVDGANVAFTVSAVPMPASSLALYRNGVLQKAGQDYTLSGNSIRFLAGSAPQPGDTILASYRVTPAGSTQGPPTAQVLCSGTGTATSSTTISSLGTCAIPAGTLKIGDRVKISFDYSHEGALAGFTFAVNWASTLLVQRNGSSADSLVSGWAEAGVGIASSQLSVQSWGTALGLAAGLVNAPDSLDYSIVLAFQGKMAAPTIDTITLRSFSVVRYPEAP